MADFEALVAATAVHTMCTKDSVRGLAALARRLAASPHADCIGYTQNLTSALFVKCAREADMNVDDVLSSDEFSDFFLCLRVPRECQPDLCS